MIHKARNCLIFTEDLTTDAICITCSLWSTHNRDCILYPGHKCSDPKNSDIIDSDCVTQHVQQKIDQLSSWIVTRSSSVSVISWWDSYSWVFSVSVHSVMRINKSTLKDSEWWELFQELTPVKHFSKKKYKEQRMTATCGSSLWSKCCLHYFVSSFCLNMI